MHTCDLNDLEFLPFNYMILQDFDLNHHNFFVRSNRDHFYKWDSTLSFHLAWHMLHRDVVLVHLHRCEVDVVIIIMVFDFSNFNYNYFYYRHNYVNVVHHDLQLAIYVVTVDMQIECKDVPNIKDTSYSQESNSYFSFDTFIMHEHIYYL